MEEIEAELLSQESGDKVVVEGEGEGEGDDKGEDEGEGEDGGGKPSTRTSAVSVTLRRVPISLIFL